MTDPLNEILPTNGIVLEEPPIPPGWVYWPNNCPKCPDKWEEISVDMRIRTSMAVGRPKTRRRNTGVMRKIAVSFVLRNTNAANKSNSQFIAMRTFYESVGNGGTHLGGTDGGYRFFKFTNPADRIEHYYRFLSPPVLSNDGPLLFRATMEWEEL